MPPAITLVTLLTDFGDRDYFVASMKGVMLNINPPVRIVDLSHQVTAHDVEEAAYLLKSSYRYFTDGTVHVAVLGRQEPGWPDRLCGSLRQSHLECHAAASAGSPRRNQEVQCRDHDPCWRCCDPGAGDCLCPGRRARAACPGQQQRTRGSLHQ